MRLIDADAIRIKPEYMHDICDVVMIRVEDIARILNDMPTIKPEPQCKKGKWLMNGERYGHMYWRCSQCGEEIDYIGANFCSNCGSYNGGEQDE